MLAHPTRASITEASEFTGCPTGEIRPHRSMTWVPRFSVRLMCDLELTYSACVRPFTTFGKQENTSLVQFTLCHHVLKSINAILIPIQQCYVGLAKTILSIHYHICTDKGTTGLIADDSCQLPHVRSEWVLHSHDAMPI